MERILCLVCKQPVSVPPWNGYRPPLSFSTDDVCPSCNATVKSWSNDAAWHACLGSLCGPRRFGNQSGCETSRERQVPYCLIWMEQILKKIRGDRLVPIKFVAMDSRLWALPSLYYVTESEPVIEFDESETPRTIDEQSHDRLVVKLLELISRGILS